MKRLGKIVVCLASGLVLNAGARADDGVLPNNPYAPIVVRNVFDLNPPPPADAGQPADPPPKITPNGIMSILGQLQVLYKVAGTAKPGQPAKDEFYILSEGQRQDEIEVVQIDEKNSLVTFNNHGIVQELPLVKANMPAVNTPTPAPGGPVPTRNFTAPSGDNSGRGRLGGRSPGGPGAARNRGLGSGSSASPTATVPASGDFSSQTTTPQSQDNLTAEEQIILMEVTRAATQKQVDAGKLPPIPPTPLTPANTPGHKGNPLIIPPPSP